MIATGRAITAVLPQVQTLRAEVARLDGKPYTSGEHQEHVVRVWTNLVSGMISERKPFAEDDAGKNQHSLASKLLHWLLPGSAPVYDSLVLQALRITVTGEPAYRQIIGAEYQLAIQLQGVASSVVGDLPATTLLRAIDKFLWWSTNQGRQTRKANLLVSLPERLGHV